MNVDETALRRVLKEELAPFEASLDIKFEIKLTKFFGQWNRYLDDRLSEFEQRVDTRLNSMDVKIDTILDRLDTDEIERAAMAVQLGRHDGWINQLAKKTKTRLAA